MDPTLKCNYREEEVITPISVQDFFAQLNKSLIQRLYDELYKPDFEMFGYNDLDTYLNYTTLVTN